MFLAHRSILPSSFATVFRRAKLHARSLVFSYIRHPTNPVVALLLVPYGRDPHQAAQVYAFDDGYIAPPNFYETWPKTDCYLTDTNTTFSLVPGSQNAVYPADDLSFVLSPKCSPQKHVEEMTVYLIYQVGRVPITGFRIEKRYKYRVVCEYRDKGESSVWRT